MLDKENFDERRGVVGIFIPIGKNYDYYHGLGGVWGELRHDKQMTNVSPKMQSRLGTGFDRSGKHFYVGSGNFLPAFFPPDCAGSADLK